MLSRVTEKCDLPPLPAVSAHALKLLRDPSSTAEDMSKLISTDATLAARVLKLSRSSMYLRRTPPSTLRDAILTVGFAGLRQILLAASVRSIFKIEKVAAQRLWAHALATALAAEELRRRHRERDGDIFLAGLLHDVGRQLFFFADADAMATLGGQDLAGEERVFGANHVQVGACLAQQWGLDDNVVLAILGHHDADPQAGALRLAQADRIADAIGHGLTEMAPDSLPALDPELEECAEAVIQQFAEQQSLFD